MTAMTCSPEVAEFVKLVGIELGPEQLGYLSDICSVGEDGKWEFGQYDRVPHERDGGKDVLEVRALAGLFLFGERTIVWAAEGADDARDSFRHMAKLVEAHPGMRKDVARIRYANGEQRIELTNGHRLLVTSPLGARGVSADALLIDGSLTTKDECSVMPVLACASNPQRVQRAGTIRA